MTQPQQNSPEQSSAKHEGAGAKWQTIKTPTLEHLLCCFSENDGETRVGSENEVPRPPIPRNYDVPSSLQAAAHSRTPGNPSSLGILMEKPLLFALESLKTTPRNIAILALTLVGWGVGWGGAPSARATSLHACGLRLVHWSSAKFELASAMNPHNLRSLGTPHLLSLVFPLRASTSCGIFTGFANRKTAWEKRVKVGVASVGDAVLDRTSITALKFNIPPYLLVLFSSVFNPPRGITEATFRVKHQENVSSAHKLINAIKPPGVLRDC